MYHRAARDPYINVQDERVPTWAMARGGTAGPMRMSELTGAEGCDDCEETASLAPKVTGKHNRGAAGTAGLYPYAPAPSAAASAAAIPEDFSFVHALARMTHGHTPETLLPKLAELGHKVPGAGTREGTSGNMGASSAAKMKPDLAPVSLNPKRASKQAKTPSTSAGKYEDMFKQQEEEPKQLFIPPPHW